MEVEKFKGRLRATWVLGCLHSSLLRNLAYLRSISFKGEFSLVLLKVGFINLIWRHRSHLNDGINPFLIRRFCKKVSRCRTWWKYILSIFHIRESYIHIWINVDVAYLALEVLLNRTVVSYEGLFRHSVYPHNTM